MANEQQRWLLIMNVIFNLVMGFILPVNTIFITKYLHESMITAGWVLMIYSLVMMLGNALGGYLFDRFSHTKTLCCGYLLAALGFVIMAVNHQWPLYPIWLVIVGLGMGISYTAVNSYTAVAAQQSHTPQKVFNAMYLAANVGIAIGSMLVSVIFQSSIFLTFFLPALCFGLCLVIVFWRGSILDGVQQVQHANYHAPSTNNGHTNQLKSQHLRLNLILLCLATLIVWLGYSQWDSNMSLYMLDRHLTMHQYSLLFSINAASLIIIQPLMNQIMTHLFQSLKFQIGTGLLIMAGSFLLLPNATHYSQYVWSMLLLTIGESVTFPTIPALLNKFANADNQGRYQSFYVIFGSLGRAVGPYLGSLLATQWTFNNLFLLIFITITLAAMGVFLVKEVR